MNFDFLLTYEQVRMLITCDNTCHVNEVAANLFVQFSFSDMCVRMIERILTTLGGNEPWRAMATKQKHFSIV